MTAQRGTVISKYAIVPLTEYQKYYGVNLIYAYCP